MANLVLPTKYADALFLLAKEKNILQKTKEELNIIKDILNNNISLKNVIFHPGISKDEKKKIFIELFSKYISDFVLNFFKLLIDKKRERLTDDIINIFSEKVDEYNNIRKVIVETAYPLETEKKEKLLNQLNKLMKAKVILNNITRDDMLGGIIIRDRLHLIDASVNQFLNSMKNKLKETKIIGIKKQSKTKTSKKKKITKKKVNKSKKINK